MAVLWPPELDTDRIDLYEDGVVVASTGLYQVNLCAAWDVPDTLGHSYHAVAIDTSGNQSDPSNVVGGLSMIKISCSRRKLAGLACE